MRTRILWLGDSITEGMAPFLGAGLVARGADVRLEAVSGISVNRWLEAPELPKMLREFRPDVTVIALGTNPSETGSEALPLGRFSAQVSELRVAVGAYRTLVIWVGPFSGVNAPVRSVEIERIMGSGRYIDGLGLAKGLTLVGVDRIHFEDPEGYRVLASRAVLALQAKVPRMRQSWGRSSALGAAAVVGAGSGALIALGGK